MMETAEINEQVVEKIAKANEMYGKLKDILAFFETNAEEFIRIKEMLLAIQKVAENKPLVLSVEEKQMNEFVSFLANDQILERIKETQGLMETSKIIKKEVAENIIQAKEMWEKLKEILIFFQAKMQKLVETKKMLAAAQDVANTNMLTLPHYKQEIHDHLSNLDWFLAYEKDLKHFIHAVEASLPKEQANETEAQKRVRELNQNFM